MGLSEVPVLVAGRIRRWEVRARCDEQGTVWAAWLRHPRCGTLGIYLPKTAAAPEGAGDRRLVRGYLAPCQVHAHGTDPRSASDPSHAPLLLRVQTITRPDATVPLPALSVHDAMLPRVRVGPGRLCTGGTLASVLEAQADDLRYLFPAGARALPVGTWQQVLGVIAEAGGLRYLQYLFLPPEVEP